MTTMNMTKLISLVAIFFITSSFDKNSKSALGKDFITTNNILRKSISLKSDTTKLIIDALKFSPANFKLLLENEYVRVLEYSLRPGEKDTPHTHPAKSSYVVSGGKLKVYRENGQTIIAEEKTGTSSWMGYVGKHYVENIGNTTVVIILTEIKSLE
jgi:beta-alanine degradation protein BauB